MQNDRVDSLTGNGLAAGTAAQRYTVINVADLSPANDPFTQILNDEVDWIGFSGLPSNFLERKIRGVKISRYRAAFQTSFAVKPNRVVISHLPLMTEAVAMTINATQWMLGDSRS